MVVIYKYHSTLCSSISITPKRGHLVISCTMRSSLNNIPRRWFSLNITRQCGYFQGCKGTVPSSTIQVISTGASWKLLRTPLSGFLEIKFWKNPARAGPRARATLALPLPARGWLFSGFARILDSFLFCFSTFRTKNEISAFFRTSDFWKNRNNFRWLST